MSAPVAYLHRGEVLEPEDFWQDLADTAYLIDGEGLRYAREALQTFLEHHGPELPAPIESSALTEAQFQRYAACRLISSVLRETGGAQ